MIAKTICAALTAAFLAAFVLAFGAPGFARRGDQDRHFRRRLLLVRRGRLR